MQAVDQRMKMRSVSFSDDPQPPNIPPGSRNQQNGGSNSRGGAGGIYTMKQNSVENLPLYETDQQALYGTQNSRLNSLPRMMPHHRRKILETNRPSSSLAGTYISLKFLHTFYVFCNCHICTMYMKRSRSIFVVNQPEMQSG